MSGHEQRHTYLKIIVIDDNPSIHQDFKKILTVDQSGEKFEKLNTLLFGNEGSPSVPQLPAFQIDTALQGQEGVECVKKAIDEGVPYALAFVDIRMPPGIDGIQTIKQIWGLDKDIQIVICTAFSDYSWEETVAELGMSDNLLILKKPFDSVAVRQFACALTKKWQLMQDEKLRMEVLENTVQERTKLLQHSLSVTRATLDSSNSGIIVVDNDGNIVDFNHFFMEMWGISETLMKEKAYAAIQNHMLSMQLVPEKYLEFIDCFKRAPNESKSLMMPLNDDRYFECYAQPHLLNGVNVGRVWSFHDITKRVALERELEYQAVHDPLTALPNRVLLMDRVNQGIAHSIRNKTMLAVMFIDLDRFKLINDSFSHEDGDYLLVNMSERLRSIVRAEDTIARLSGDEFVLASLSASIHNNEDIIKIATKVLKEISSSIMIADREISITASIGVSIYPQDGETPEALLRNADLAMYRAKELGGNQFQFYTEQMNVRTRVRLEKESDLRLALDKNELFLNYQPQYDVKNKKLVGVEALVRWQHPEQGLLLPMDFIPLAEDTGLIVPIGEWLLRTACAQNKAWQEEGLPKIVMSVNVATKQFMQANFVVLVETVLQETGLEAKYLEIEVTENVIVSNINVIDSIKKLKEMGVGIVLDDFGTGNSGLNYLRTMPIDKLKIDQTFIQKIDENRSDEVIIQAIIAMAESLNLEVVAEGVESQGQMQFLEKKHCQSFQGYYFSKPVPADELKKLLKK